MKVFLLVFLASLTLARTVEKHYHIHMDGLDASTQRQLLQLKPGHKGFFNNLWCYLKNPVNKTSRQACVDKSNKSSKTTTTTTVVANTNNGGRKLAAEKLSEIRSFDHKLPCWMAFTKAQKAACAGRKRYLGAEKLNRHQRALVARFHYKIDGAKDKCRRLSVGDAQRNACFQAANAQARRLLSELGNPSHKGFWGKFKCFVKHLFNKEKREQCYRDVQNAEDAKNAAIALNAQADANNNVVPSSKTTTNVTTTTTKKRRLSAQRRALIQKFEHKLTWAQTKCYRYFYSKQKRQACLDALKTQTHRYLAQIGDRKHRGFWGKFKCLVKHLFNKEKRQQCYQDVQAAEDAKNAAVVLNYQATADSNVVPATKTTTNVTTTTAKKRRLSAHKRALVEKFDHKISWAQTKCYRYFYSKQKRQACLDALKTQTARYLAQIGDPSHKAFWGKFKCLVKHLFNKEKREQCYKDVQAAEDNKNAAITLDAQAATNANVGNPNPPANNAAPTTTTKTTTSNNVYKRRLSHAHVVDSTGCFFKFMFNSQKRAKCNADAKAKRDAANKKSASDKAAKKLADEKAAAEKKAADEAAERAANKKIGLNAKGKANHNASKVVETGIY